MSRKAKIKPAVPWNLSIPTPRVQLPSPRDVSAYLKPLTAAKPQADRTSPVGDTHVRVLGTSDPIHPCVRTHLNRDPEPAHKCKRGRTRSRPAHEDVGEKRIALLLLLTLKNLFVFPSGKRKVCLIYLFPRMWCAGKVHVPGSHQDVKHQDSRTKGDLHAGEEADERANSIAQVSQLCGRSCEFPSRAEGRPHAAAKVAASSAGSGTPPEVSGQAARADAGAQWQEDAEPARGAGAAEPAGSLSAGAGC